MIYNAGNGENRITVQATNAQALREQYAHMGIIAIQPYTGNDIGFEFFGKK
jgi:hypothetical protein